MSITNNISGGAKPRPIHTPPRSVRGTPLKRGLFTIPLKVELFSYNQLKIN